MFFFLLQSFRTTFLSFVCNFRSRVLRPAAFGLSSSFSQTNTAYVCFKLEMHTGSEGCAVAFLFVSASKSTSSCRLQGLLGVSERAVRFLPSACAKVALRKPQRLRPRLNNMVAMTSLMGCWTLPRWWIGTCQTGKLCTTGLDCMLSLSLSLSRSATSPPPLFPLPFSSSS